MAKTFGTRSVIVLAAACVGIASLPSLAAAPVLPKATDILFWSPSEQDVGFSEARQDLSIQDDPAGIDGSRLPKAAEALDIRFTYDHRPYATADMFKVNRTSAVLVIKDGKVVLEHYAPGRTAQQRWPSFSMAKSITSTLVGAAIADGYIASIDDPVTEYLPELHKSAYEGVTIRDLLMMSSGVDWNEDYNDPASDRARSGFLAGPDLVAVMAAKRRVADPGKTFHYKTADTGILGAIVTKAAARPLSRYLSEKIWSRYGMEADASWILHGEQEVAGTCLSARLRDMGRFGMFILDDGVIGADRVLPVGWVKEATTGRLATPYGRVRYGYQWWVHPDGTFEAVGIMGQSMLIDPLSRTVVVIQSAWNNAGTDEEYRLQRAFQDAVLAAVRAR